MILDLDVHLEKSLKEVPATVQTSNAYNKPHRKTSIIGNRALLTSFILDRSVALCVLHNRVSRIGQAILYESLTESGR